MSIQTELLSRVGEESIRFLKALLEEKHLYQQTRIEADTVAKTYIDAEPRANLKSYLAGWWREIQDDFRFTLSIEAIRMVPRDAGLPTPPVVTLVLPHVSTFCRTCKRKEAFKPVWFVDADSEMRKSVTLSRGTNGPLRPTRQMFLLLYQCQRCLGAPEGFLVRRDGWLLGLHGRSPIEIVEIPAYIPGTEAWLFRNSILAYNSGKPLAALFYLRSCVEQFAKRVTGIAGRSTGEEVLNAYYETLPEALKAQMPSLRKAYDSISDALHSAREDDELFQTARADVEKHFEIRKVFKISEPKPAASPSTEPKPADGG